MPTEEDLIKKLHHTVVAFADIGWSPKDIQEQLDKELDKTFTEVKEDESETQGC